MNATSVILSQTIVPHSPPDLAEIRATRSSIIKKYKAKPIPQHFRTFYPFHDVMPNPIFRDFDGCVDYLTTGSRPLLA
jgi:hypothetical protein